MKGIKWVEREFVGTLEMPSSRTKMEKKIARINWSRGQYSDVYHSAIIDPSPLKPGQSIKVVWGKTRKEYTAVIESYPINGEKETHASQDDLPPRRARAKRKLVKYLITFKPL